MDAKPSLEGAGQARKRRDFLAAVLVLVIGAPFIVLYARAMAEGETHRREGPLRAMVGSTTFDRLQRGDKTDEHYLGNALRAPDFELVDRDGKPWRLKDHRGKIVVMNFWTVTCQPCVAEMPSILELDQLARQHGGIEVIAVTTDKNWSEVATLFPPNSRLTVLFDPERKVVRDKFGTKLFPETWVIDPRGVVRMRVDGSRNWSEALSLAAIESFE